MADSQALQTDLERNGYLGFNYIAGNTYTGDLMYLPTLAETVWLSHVGV